MELFIKYLADLAREYAALFISICALILTISQAKAIRKHNRLTSDPTLQHIRKPKQTRNVEEFW